MVNPGDLQVVAVSDFRGGTRRRRFELRALLQVRGWWRHARTCCRLRIVTVGDPPRSVLDACEAAEVELVPGEPVEAGVLSGFANKILGFETVSDGTPTLLVDTDVLFLGAPDAGLADSSDKATVRVLPAALPRLSEAAWVEVLRSLGLADSGRRIPSLNTELRIPFEKDTFAGQSTQADAMFPCYNSGVIWTDHAATLAARWREHAEEVGTNRRVDEAMLRAGGDQTVLATAIQSLGDELRLERLSAETNTLYSHLATGAVRTDDIVGLHFMRLFEAAADDLTSGVRRSWSYFESRCRSIWRRQWTHARDVGLAGRVARAFLDLRRLRSRLVEVARQDLPT